LVATLAVQACSFKLRISANSWQNFSDNFADSTCSNVPEDLALAKSNARTARLAANRALSCERCLEQQANPPEGPLSS
jgi:hypothetical protein